MKNIILTLIFSLFLMFSFAQKKVYLPDYKNYYGSNQSIQGGFHSLTADANNWIGVYEFDTTQPFNIGACQGVAHFLPATQSGNYTPPASVTNQLTSGKVYILKFANGAGGIGLTDLGTSHPFYKL